MANSLLMNLDCPVDTSSSKTAHQHTQLVPHRTGSKPTARDFIFIAKDQWPPNSPDLNPLDYHVWGAMLEAYHKRHLKPKMIAELKEVLQVIWDSLPQGPIDKAVKEFSKRLKACVAAEGGHFEHSQILQCRDCYICLNDVIAWTYFERAKIARWQHCNAVNFRIL